MIPGLNMTVAEPLSSKRMIRLLTLIMFAAIPTQVSLLASKVSLISCATDKSASVAGVDFWARKLGSFVTGLIIASLELVSQCRGFGNAVRLVNIADREYTGDEHLVHNRPLIQGGGALKGDTDTIENRGFLFLAAADQRALFAEELVFLAANHEAEHLIDHGLDL